jgi:hypothetical protein
VFTSTGYEHCFFCAGVFAVIAAPAAPIITVEFLLYDDATYLSVELLPPSLWFSWVSPSPPSWSKWYIHVSRLSYASILWADAVRSSWSPMPTDHHDLRCRQIIMILDADRPLWSLMPITWSIDELYPVLQHSMYRLIFKLMIKPFHYAIANA